MVFQEESVTEEPLIHAIQNISSIELKIQSKDKPPTKINSFETYQQEHKKWFGERRRTSPVNNFDIDWAQMRKKVSFRGISSWQTQKSEHRRTIPSTETLSPVSNSSSWPKVLFNEDNTPELNKYKARPFFRNYISDEKDLKVISHEGLEPPFGKADKDGKTAFGRLYQEPKKRHYLLHDNRNLFFDRNEIKNLINKTYDAEFRIKTHRRTHWYNRTFDPKYVFTQLAPLRNIYKQTVILPEIVKTKLNFSELTVNAPKPINQNDSHTVDPHFDSYVKLLRGHKVISIRPKHISFRDVKNNTVVVNQENETFILQRSNKIPWDNVTDLGVYKTYRKSRKRFYNKTIDIVFSYYIFHKFHCGNASRDVGYGRMSNVVNRWYNRTFVPKYRPDMFYLHNRYKSGKEFNYYNNEFNIIHTLMSEGRFDPNRWAQVIPGLNKSEEKRSRVDEEFNRINKESAEYEKGIQHALRSKEESRENMHSTTFPRTTMKMFTSLRWKEKPGPKINHRLFTTFRPTNTPKLSFFQAVKEKSFSFLKNLFSKENTNKKES